jgi:hypothetical protein
MKESNPLMQKFNVFQKHQKAIILHVGNGRDLAYGVKMVASGVAETRICNTQKLQ